ncbi:transcription factor COE4-like [Xenia sp. Carnegie-2017]|uniref:transcription factor COE4-like n=1 Tax=Xenia sp. Carnegie-2017 TaxID=2897299 RepID=UPI001F03A4A9|nr:transcription factor COE4-like [Xenia sp. Carnegie-2017]
MQERTSPVGNEVNFASNCINRGKTSPLSRVDFTEQPPKTVRKSNFFSFVLKLFDSRNQPIVVDYAKFSDFIEQDQKKCNGICYFLILTCNAGLKYEQFLDIRLVDSNSKEIIQYEGQDKNPHMRKVLITHEVNCSRCNENKSCGNRNETPCDPTIDRSKFGELKFFMKCNQNCLKQAGNPRGMRRFQVMVSIGNFVLGYSENVFVHNNSKHSRGNKVRHLVKDIKLDAYPMIKAICPCEGLTLGGTSVLVIGDNFFEGLQVLFGPAAAWIEMISPTMINVLAPPNFTPGSVDVTLSYLASRFCTQAPGKFMYLAEPTLDFQLNRLQKLTKHVGDPENLSKEIILRRAADVLENIYKPLPNTPSSGYIVDGTTLPNASVHSLPSVATLAQARNPGSMQDPKCPLLH